MLLDILYIVFLIFSVAYLFTLIAISIFILYRTYQTRMINLIFLSMSYAAAATSTIGNFLFNISLVLEVIILSLTFVFAAIFTNLTFYKEHKHITSKLILIVVFINYFTQIYLSYLVWSGNTPILNFIFTLHICFERFVVFSWLGWSSYQTHKGIKSPNMVPWIITRYKLITFTSIIFLIQPFFLFFQSWDLAYGDPSTLPTFLAFGFSASLVIVASIGLILAWFMPNWFKTYLDKGYEPLVDKEYSEEEISVIIQYLGNILAEEINLSIPASRGMIKLAIQEEFNPIDFTRPLNYGNLKHIIQNPLRERLIKLNIENIEEVLENLENQLIKGQSLASIAII